METTIPKSVDEATYSKDKEICLLKEQIQKLRKDNEKYRNELMESLKENAKLTSQIQELQKGNFSQSYQQQIEEYKSKINVLQSEKAKFEQMYKQQNRELEEVRRSSFSSAEKQRYINEINRLKEQCNLAIESRKTVGSSSSIKAEKLLEQYSNDIKVLNETNDAFYTGLMNILGPAKLCDPIRAFNAFNRASEGGNRYASFIIGLMLEVGQIVQKDIQRAIKYYQKSFDQGNTKGYNRIGFLHVVGIDGRKNFDAAYEYFKKAADLGDPFAINNIGILYQNGLHFHPKNIQKAFEFFEQAAKMHEPFSLFNLAKMYESGTFLKQDHSLARYYYSEAAKYGHPSSVEKS